MDPSSIILPSSVAPSLYGSMISEWTDPWSDGSICLLKNIPSLTSWPRVINVVETRGIYLVVNLLERSIPSSSVSFPLYKPASSSLIFHFPQKFFIRALQSPLLEKHTIHLVHPSSTPFCCLSPTSKYPSPSVQISYLLDFILSSSILDLSMS